MQFSWSPMSTVAGVSAGPVLVETQFPGPTTVEALLSLFTLL